jgi:hypothetical protein
VEVEGPSSENFLSIDISEDGDDDVMVDDVGCCEYGEVGESVEEVEVLLLKA